MIHYRMGVKNLEHEKALPKPQTARAWLWAMASSQEPGEEGAFPLLCPAVPTGIQTSP